MPQLSATNLFAAALRVLGGRADHPRRVHELGPHHRNVAPQRQRARHPTSCRNGSSSSASLAAEICPPRDDHFRIEHMRQPGERCAQHLRCSLDNVARHRIALLREFENLGASRYFRLAGGQARFHPAMQSRERLALNGARRKQSLEAPTVAADAKRPVGVNRQMPNVSGRARRTAQNPAIGENAAAHTRPQREHHRVPAFPRGAPGYLSRQCHAGIIVSGNRDIRGSTGATISDSSAPSR